MFLHRLAGHLGKSIAEIQELGASEIATWRIFFRDDPQGTDRTDVLVAALGTSILNMLRQNAKTRVFKPRDWMPRIGIYKDELSAQPATPEQVVAVMSVFEGLGMARRVDDGKGTD